MPFPSFTRRNSVAERRTSAIRPSSLFGLSDWALFDMPKPQPQQAPPRQLQLAPLRPLPENHSYTLTAADTAFHTPTPRRRTQSAAAPRPMSAYASSLPPGAAEAVLALPGFDTRNNYTPVDCSRVVPINASRPVPVVRAPRSTGFDIFDAHCPSDRSARRDLGFGAPQTSHYQKRSAMFNISSPMGNGNGNTDFGPKLASHERDVIHFSQPVRKRNFAGSVSSIDRDPFKIRDGLQSRKASSGVYTPNTFPGPSVQQQRPNQSFPATSPTLSTFSNDSGSSSSHHRRPAYRVRSLGSFQRFSVHKEEPLPPLPISNPTNPRTSYYPQYATPKPSYSPTSARSGASISPPDTPTTPTSVNISGHSVPASSVARPVVIMSQSDFGPGVDFSRSPVESSALGLGFEEKPTSYLRSRSSDQAPQLPPIDASPSAMPSPPAGPTTPPVNKRTRRKPVPRLDEDMIEHLEALETGSGSRPHAL
ncbi:hypothetical protein Q8F55_009069 [Vanrija albida]|uniref:Uncharacterized protein n=1 Tax=Vanrija albida TaxID=181172 RepID=A0ABR3PTJ9_9TREE